MGFGRLGVAGAMVAVAACAVQAAGRPGVDPNWPCQQPKVADFPLASVWDGPPIGAGTGWRDDPDVAGLASEMAQRRVPIADVQAAVAKLVATPDAKAKLASAFGVAFDVLTQQRSQIIAGLDRFGRKQRDMADRIRAENETAHSAASPGMAPDEAALQKLQWDLRVYDDRRRTISYVCEAPQAIEARIGAIVRIVRPQL
jgi:hypothetical protein